ncbi:MAG TPA: carboxylesterase [Gammaproteobacteria bacterium]|jgi:phospholipase/carboxylesterase
MEDFDGIERETGFGPDLSMIWLHGLGADATDFLPIIDALDLATTTRFIFPNAPRRAVTINGGMVMRAWYDISGFGANAAEDTEGLTRSAESVRRLVHRELERGIDASRILLAGFSQGGAVVLHAGLAGDVALGGILGLSTYLPAVGLLQDGPGIRSDIPVMLTHGIYDPVIPLAIAERSAALLTGSGVAVDWSTYRMGHEVVAEEIGHINDWLRGFGSR